MRRIRDVLNNRRRLGILLEFYLAGLPPFLGIKDMILGHIYRQYEILGITIILRRHTSSIFESNDAAVLGCIGWAIEQHLNDIPIKLKPNFQQILNDIKARKEILERS